VPEASEEVWARVVSAEVESRGFTVSGKGSKREVLANMLGKRIPVLSRYLSLDINIAVFEQRISGLISTLELRDKIPNLSSPEIDAIVMVCLVVCRKVMPPIEDWLAAGGLTILGTCWTKLTGMEAEELTSLQFAFLLTSSPETEGFLEKIAEDEEPEDLD